jgi:hypothetical protein
MVANDPRGESAEACKAVTPVCRVAGCGYPRTNRREGLKMNKIPSLYWHTQNGERARQINELLQKLIVETQSQYKRPSWEYRILESINALFRVWRDRMDNNQYSEIRDHEQRSFWFGRVDKFNGGQ